MTLATLFIAQALNVPLTWGEQLACPNVRFADGVTMAIVER
jgi:Na+/H+-dicarboxylate symporter